MPVPDFILQYNLDKLSINYPPFVPIAQRLSFTLIDLVEKYQKDVETEEEKVVNEEKKLEYSIYEGNKKDITMESWEKGKHCLVSLGRKYYCPCVIGQKCLLRGS